MYILQVKKVERQHSVLVFLFLFAMQKILWEDRIQLAWLCSLI